MSGICGFMRVDGAPAAADDVRAMLASMARRGPDHQHGWCAGSTALGHALLATTAEAMADTQPWVHPDSGCVVVSDSRLDNRPELLRTLGLPHAAPDQIGDGALLHAAYQRWDADCPKHLLGDFAFAIWDPQRQRLFCARDQMGVRPFYYCHLPGRLFAFASEAEVLLRLPGVPGQINEVRIVDFLEGQLEGFDATSTYFEAILRMPAAHACKIESMRLSMSRYWTPTDDLPTSPPRSDDQWAEELRAHLTQAVRSRLRGTHRVCSMLSGGLDSSTVVALASAELARNGKGPLPTFSSINSAEACPETDSIRAMLALPGIAPTLFDIADNDAAWDALEAHREQIVEPFDGSMTLVAAQYIAAQRSGVRAMLDGIDADTLFSGGSRIARLLHDGHWPTALREARSMARFHRGKFPSWKFLRSDLAVVLVPEPLLRLRKRIQLAHRHLRRSTSALISPEFARRVAFTDRVAALSARFREAPGTPLQEHSLEMTNPYLAAGIERYGRVAAAHACEPRHPFLDRRLLGFALTLPDALRQRDGWPKWILRQAMRDALPEEICWRRSKEHLGWRTSRSLLERFGDQRLRAIVNDHSTLSPYLNMRRLEEHFGHWLQHRDDDSYEPLYAAMVLHGWLQRMASTARPGATDRIV